VKYRAQLSPCAAQAFSHLNPAIRKRLKTGLKELAGNPYAGKELQGDLAEFRNCRIKRYRIIYTVVTDENTLKVYAIGHRREIYDLFSEFALNRQR
jgi:addiction module RelE/StbE family toxin